MNTYLRQTFLFLAGVSLFAFALQATHAQHRARGSSTNSSAAKQLVEEGYALSDQGKWAEAIETFKRAIKADPKYADSYSGLGDAYLNSGKWAEALAVYKEAVRIAPSDAVAQYNLGYLYNLMGRHGDAFPPLVKATSLDPGFAEAHYEIGYAYLRGRDYEKSIPYFRNALRLNPNYAEAHYGLAVVFTRLGKLEAAEASRRALLALDPNLIKKLDRELNSSAPPLPALLPPSATAPAIKESPRVATESPRVDTAAPKTAPSPTLEVAATQQPPAATTPEVPKEGDTKPAVPVSSSPSGPISVWPEKTKRWAVVIGIENYSQEQIGKFSGGANDARALASALVQHAGFPANQVILLATDQPAQLQPRRSTILRSLSNLRGTVPPDGLVLFAFTGHGIERSGRSYLLPADALTTDDLSLLEDTAINVSRVKELIRATGVTQVLLLLDAWRNDPTPARSGADNALSPAFSKGLTFDLNNSPSAFATLYATGLGQRAYEDQTKKQGYFTSQLIEALMGQAANEKGEVTLGSLSRYIQDTVPKYVHRDLGPDKQQTPVLIVEGYKPDDLVIAVTGKNPP